MQHLAFKSKAQALALMKKKYPYFFNKGMPPLKNVLPDSYTAVPDQLSDLSGLAKSVTSAHWPGVQNVQSGSILRSLCGVGSA